jgi:hypothetical protein
MTRPFPLSSCRRESYQAYAVGKYKGRNSLITLAAILIILMLGLPLVSAYGFTQTAYATEFIRSTSNDCNTLGPNIQSTFEGDQNNGQTFVIKENGSYAFNKTQTGPAHNGNGDFKFVARTQDSYYKPSGYPGQYPSIYASAGFLHYKLYNLTFLADEPANGFTTEVAKFNLSSGASYNLNFSNPYVGGILYYFNITVKQTSNQLQAWFSIYKTTSSTPVFQEELYDSVPYPSYSNPPPYAVYGAGDSIDGLENGGYAHILSGTDFQIKSWITPYTSTDYTNQSTVSYTYANSEFPFTGCHYQDSSYEDDEGDDATYSYGGSGSYTGGNQVYQYVKVSAYTTSSIIVNSVNQLGNPITGYYTGLYDQNNNFITSGYTSVTFGNLIVQRTYFVYPENYAGCTFNHWQDSGSTTQERQVNANGQTLTAVYGITPGYASCP